MADTIRRRLIDRPDAELTPRQLRLKKTYLRKWKTNFDAVCAERKRHEPTPERRAELVAKDAVFIANFYVRQAEQLTGRAYPFA